MASKINIHATNTTLMPKCVIFLIMTAFFSLYLSVFRISIQKLVVRAARAESALENAAAIIPMVKNTNTA